MRKFYTLPKFTDDFLKVLVVDAPILDIQSSGLLSADGQGAIRDAWDRKIDYDLRRSYESSALAVKASSSASIVARATVVWAKKLLTLVPQTDTKVLEGLSRTVKANSFIADATLDTLTFSSRSIAAEVHTHRALWLCAWQADIKAKQIVAAYPFSGEKLFGSHLDKILVETRDKKKVMPNTLK